MNKAQLVELFRVYEKGLAAKARKMLLFQDWRNFNK
jgi:hypothetical protein